MQQMHGLAPAPPQAGAVHSVAALPSPMARFTWHAASPSMLHQEAHQMLTRALVPQPHMRIVLNLHAGTSSMT